MEGNNLIKLNSRRQQKQKNCYEKGDQELLSDVLLQGNWLERAGHNLAQQASARVGKDVHHHLSPVGR